MIFPAVPVVDVTQACLQKLNHPQLAGVDISVLRLDTIHAEISGNKWFKLKKYIEQVYQQQKEGIITFGGAYSNHLLAVAASCHELKLKSAAIIRGERPARPGSTLTDLEQKGMELNFISRADYAHKAAHENLYKNQFPDLLLVPEGGAGEPGIAGASAITELFGIEMFTHIICAIGTGTMAAGILRCLTASQTLFGIPVLKIADQSSYNVNKLLAAQKPIAKFQLYFDYHFGGYAKTTSELFQFMNDLYIVSGIPTDFVYTAKTFYALFDLVAKGYFTKEAKVLIIHSGGLQGNRSLSEGVLRFLAPSK
jgi:D-cysteine desulfhydrase